MWRNWWRPGSSSTSRSACAASSKAVRASSSSAPAARATTVASKLAPATAAIGRASLAVSLKPPSRRRRAPAPTGRSRPGAVAVASPAVPAATEVAVEHELLPLGLDEERVATGHAGEMSAQPLQPDVEVVTHLPLHQLVHARLVEALELQGAVSRLAGRQARQQLRERRVGAGGAPATRADDEGPRIVRSEEQVLEEQRRRRPSPVEVVEDEEHRCTSPEVP